MKDVAVAIVATISLFALICAAANQLRLLTIKMYRDAFPDETNGLTDEQVTKLDDFKNNF